MREILFKGFHENENGSTVNGEEKRGEWVEGFLYVTHSGEYEIICYNSGIKIERYTYVVIPETVCQYTGRHNRHNVKAFDGDIIMFAYCNKSSTGKVVFNEKTCGFEVWYKTVVGAYGETAIHKINFASVDDFEIIGNIFENPELLESEA